MNNPILIGQAEVIDLVQPKVRAMLANEGVYIGGDSRQPELLVVLISQAGKVNCVKLDTELSPEGFVPTLTLHGPYGPQPPEVLEHMVELLAKAHATIDGLFAQLILADHDFRPTKSPYWADMVAITEMLKVARGEA